MGSLTSHKRVVIRDRIYEKEHGVHISANSVGRPATQLPLSFFRVAS